MKLKKKKKGSAFLIVIMVLTITSILGTAMLAVTAADYRMRKNESERLKNLYEADSGLSIVEDIIIQTSKEAINYADNAVKESYSTLTEGKKTKEGINELFKDKFYGFLNNEDDLKIGGKDIIGSLLENLIETKQYLVLENGELKYAKSGINENASIELEDYEFNKNNGISIKVSSTFETMDGELKNKKTVETTFEITAPNYNSNISIVDIYPVFDKKSLTADGNLNITGGTLNIKGDIWIRGNTNLEQTEEYSIFDKYRDGITLEDTKFYVDGNIFTANTFHLKNNVEEAYISGDLFADNLYVGKSLYDIESDDNNITFGKNVVLNNDLALNATNSSIIINNNFFGINDKTIGTDTSTKALDSSSIIVNEIIEEAGKKSSIVVNNNSYIMGVAYLDAIDSEGNNYKTGESVAVKGNYLAYTDVDNLEEGYVLKYYNPLQLLESNNTDSSVQMKSKFFEEYYSNNSKTYKLNAGGVILGVNEGSKIYSVGASINKNGKVQGSNITEQPAIIKEQQKSFARNVLAMGDGTDEELEDLYNANFQVENRKTLGKRVNNQINFQAINYLENKIIQNSGKIVLLVGNNKELNITTIEDKTIFSIEGEKPLEIENGGKVVEGLIISNGNINIGGEFNFAGNIITSESINVTGNTVKNISYDENIIRNILTENGEILGDIFKTDYSKAKAEEIKIGSVSDLYNSNNFLKKSSWKIVK